MVSLIRLVSGFGLCLTALFLLSGQQVQGIDPVPRTSGFQPRTFAITKARIVPAAGQTLEEANLIIRDGLIVAVGKDAAIPADAEIIEASGLMVYPGLIDAATTTGLDPAKPAVPAPGRPVDFNRYALTATNPDNRKGITPEFRAAERLLLNADDLDRRRKAGFTTIHIVPSTGLASGDATLVSLSGKLPRESILLAPSAASFHIHALDGDDYPETGMGALAHLRQAFLDADLNAKHQTLYQANTAGITTPLVDAALKSLQSIKSRKLPVLFMAGTRDEIHRSLDFAAEQQLQPVLRGGQQAQRCLDRLEKERVPVILQLDFGEEPKIEPPQKKDKLDPEEKDPLRVQQDRHNLWKERVAAAAKLHAQKVRFAFSSQGLKEPADFLKGIRQVIQAGLARDAALVAITSDAATILGQESRLGTLAADKLAHVVILTGPFDNEQSQVRYVFVDGQKYEYNTDAKPLPDVKSGTVPLDLTGIWQLEITSSEGKLPGTLRLTQTGTKLSGTFESMQGDGKVTSGNVTAEKFDLAVSIGAGGRAVELKFEGKPAGMDRTKLEGSLKSAFGAATTWTATRNAPPADSKNPIKLGLETDDAKSADKDDKAVPPLPTELQTDRLQRHIKTGGNVLIRQGTVLTGRGEALTGTSILVKAGKIAAIGKALEPEVGMTVIDANGKFVMPGIIDTHSHMMIDGGVMHVNEATLSIVPEVRIRDMVWTDDVTEYRALAGGVTAARLLHGSANVVGGQDVVVKLKYGATAAEHIVKDAPRGVKFALGENVKFRHNRFPTTRLGVEATLKRAFAEALDYRRQWMAWDKLAKESPDKAKTTLPPRRDLRLDALVEILNQERFIHSHCYRADEILMLLRTADSVGIKVRSLQHVLEGYKVAPEIAAHGASCSTFADWWAFKMEAYDAIPHNAALLTAAGVNTCIKSDDWELIRHLPREAAKTLRYGHLPPETVLQFVTYNPARELGLQDRMGSLEVGKDADIAIFNAHPLDAFSRCEQTLIEGEVYFTRDKQPSAMPEEIAKKGPPNGTPFLPPPELRDKTLDLTESPNKQYALVGGVLHPVDGPDIAGGTLLIADGKITAVAKDAVLPPEAKKIELGGLHVYPGLIDVGTTLGLTEIGKVRETHDESEGGVFQPDLRAGIAVNPDSELIPVARAGGVTTILASPTGALISGQCSLVKLEGWTVPDMVLDWEAGLHINWPIGPKDKKKEVDERIKQLKDFLAQARVYLKAKKAGEQTDTQVLPDPRFDAMKPYLEEGRTIFIATESRKAISEALLFAEQEKLKIAIMGGTDAWKLVDELKKREIPVVIGPVIRKPENDFDPLDAPYANAARLQAAGVLFCFRGAEWASNVRNLPFQAAMSVAYGLSPEEALRGITLNAAKILKIDDRTGSLTAGKRADLIITDGSPLQPATHIKGIFIGGKPLTPESKQTRLYEKYRARLNNR